ncbi:RNA-binding S4 domain-containing protein [candidate division KSB1 bacterium]
MLYFVIMDDFVSLESQRLDKWLKIVRLFKTRKLAAHACESHKVKVNEVTSKPAKNIRIGDEVVIRLRGKYRSFEVLGVPKRSISTKLAREMYKETTPRSLTDEQEELVKLSLKSVKREKPKYPGRPTKKSRRELDKWKTNSS